MERQNRFEPKPRSSDDEPRDSDLDQVRDDVDRMFTHADNIMDSFSHLDAQEYLEQNRQTGGQ